MVIASIVGSALLVAVGAVIGGVTLYLVFRANPNKKAVVDKFVDQTKNKL